MVEKFDNEFYVQNPRKFRYDYIKKTSHGLNSCIM